MVMKICINIKQIDVRAYLKMNQCMKPKMNRTDVDTFMYQ